MKWGFTLDDVIGGKAIGPEFVLVNLTGSEYSMADSWLRRLREVEAKNVVGSLATVLAYQEHGNALHQDKKAGFAMVAAGSSLHAADYNDIDIFMIPETFEHGSFLQRITLLDHMARVIQGPLPGFAQGNRHPGFNGLFSFKMYTPGGRLGKDEQVHGKQIQMYLLLDKFDFEFPRPEREGDIIYRPGLNAEHLIALNRMSGTHMIPLLRSYVLRDYYSQSAAGSLEIEPSEIVGLYHKALVGTVPSGTPVVGLLNAIGATFEQYFAEGNLLSTPSQLRRELRQAVIAQVPYLLESRPLANYADALINQKVKEKFDFK